MFNRISPESAGISSEAVIDFVEYLESCNLRMHSILMMKGNEIFTEMYYAPFDKDSTHRMYSVTKSFVSVAIGLLEEDGVISLDDRIADYFPEKIDTAVHPFIAMQTIRDMLKMSTAGEPEYWFSSKDRDRSHLYLNNNNSTLRPPATLWEYDSPGSQLMCALVEKLTGKTMLQFLDERIFSHLGYFKTAKMLKVNGGDSWGDSAMICTPRDLLTFARFVMNKGVWNGKRLMNEEYLTTATSPLVCNLKNGHRAAFHYGYGYQFWMCKDGFAFVGMGDQLAICMPKQDIIFVCTADNQGNNPPSRDIIVSAFQNLIIKKAAATALPENPEAKRRLDEISGSRVLFAFTGVENEALKRKIDGVVYECEDNAMGLKDFRFDFGDNGEGVMTYRNDGGEMVLPFGLNKNVFGLFPELGYSKEVGGERTTDGHKYGCATSLAFLDENKLIVAIQILDDYYANASFIIAFRDEYAVVNVEKTAEDFLWNYNGRTIAKIKE